MRHESLREFIISQYSVPILIVSWNEHGTLIKGWINTQAFESDEEFLNSDHTISISVENIKGINQIEVVSQGNGLLMVLELLFKITHFLQSMN